MIPELLGLHPDNLQPLYIGNRALDSGFDAVCAALRVAFETGEKIDALATELNANKDLSPAGRVRKFRDKELQLRDAALAKINSVKALIEARIKDGERKMSAPPPPEDEDSLRRESNLIAAIRDMKPEERSKLRDQENIEDDELARAILRSHHVAIGMTKNEQELFRISWQRRRFPEHADYLNRLNSALGHIERAVPILSAYAEKKANGLAGVCVSR